MYVYIYSNNIYICLRKLYSMDNGIIGIDAE